MKKLLLFIAVATMPLWAFAQSVVESTKECSKTKAELYSIVRMFISDAWNNPERAITNEDKELGVIQITSKTYIAVNAGMGFKNCYTYQYNTRFRVKDNKYKIEIYDVECLDAEQRGVGSPMAIPKIPYFEGDNAPEKTKSLGKGVSKKKAIEMMNDLRLEFDAIIKAFEKYLNEFDSDF